MGVIEGGDNFQVSSAGARRKLKQRRGRRVMNEGRRGTGQGRKVDVPPRLAAREHAADRQLSDPLCRWPTVSVFLLG